MHEYNIKHDGRGRGCATSLYSSPKNHKCASKEQTMNKEKLGMTQELTCNYINSSCWSIFLNLGYSRDIIKQMLRSSTSRYYIMLGHCSLDQDIQFKLRKTSTSAQNIENHKRRTERDNSVLETTQSWKPQCYGTMSTRWSHNLNYKRATLACTYFLFQ